jgi:hypothetical protein
LNTMSKPCSSISKAPGRAPRGSNSRKTKPVRSRCASKEASTARLPKPGRFGLGQRIGRRPPASGLPGRSNCGSARRMGLGWAVLQKRGANR